MTSTPQQLIPLRIDTIQASWVDVNTNARVNGQPDLVTDVPAINNALRNLFTCPMGTRGPIFRPRYGTYLHHFLQEPIDLITAQKIRASAIQSIQQNEPRVNLIAQQTYVIPAYQVTGYLMHLSYIYILKNVKVNADFILTQ